MKLLRNPEVLKCLMVYVIISLIASGIAFWQGAEEGVFVAGLCCAFVGIYLWSTYRRYKKIGELSARINKILHGKDDIFAEKYSEGELGILESEIYKMTVRLREQQKILEHDKAYLADSIADISHQIRTPLTSINLLVQFISKPDITEERRSQLVRELYELLAHIEWLITTLLKMSKLDVGTVQFKKENETLEELVKKACAPLLVPIELRGQELEIKGSGTFVGDVSWTCEAIVNIVKNCMEHTPEGGKIRIEFSENSIYREIVISDNGKGIDKEDLPHIFERFYNGKNSDDKSYGIGLALARMIIAEQNGVIKAENIQSGGAMFTIRFYNMA